MRNDVSIVSLVLIFVLIVLSQNRFADIVDASSIKIKKALGVHGHEDESVPIGKSEVLERRRHLQDVFERGQSLASCGKGQLPTSLLETSNRFHEANAHFEPLHDGQWGQIHLSFAAYDSEGQARLEGGDEFKFTLTYWNNSTAVKLAEIPQDQLDGTYNVTFLVPGGNFDYRLHVNHRYTCFEGHRWDRCDGVGCVGGGRQYQILNSKNTHVADFGPVALRHEGFDRQSSPNKVVQWDTFPRETCMPSQYDIESYANRGYWVDNDWNGTFSKEALWVSTDCKLEDKGQSSDYSILRIGDSTMPRAFLGIGYPFQPIYPNYQRWIHLLLENKRLLQAKEMDVVVFQAGHHHLFWGLAPEAAVDNILLMLCQLAARTKAKIVLLGPNPIQQDRFHAVDQRDGDGRLVSELLYNKVVIDHKGDLHSICTNLELPLTQLVIVPDFIQGKPSQNVTFVTRTIDELIGENKAKFLEELSGEGIAPLSAKDKRLIKQANLGGILTIFETLLEEEFLGTMWKVNGDVFLNRTVFLSSIYNFLLPREDVYRLNDKIHDMGFDLAFFGTKHLQMMNEVGELRSRAGR